MLKLPYLGRNRYSQQTDRSVLKGSQAGQALVVVLLVLSVVLALVLSVTSRSITDISITTYEEDAARAFSAAEAGVEEALISGVGSSGTVSEATYETTIDTPTQGSSFNYPNPLSSGDIGTLWHVSHTTGGDELVCSGDCSRAPNLEVCWGTPGASGSAPAVEVVVFYDDTLSSVASPNNYANLKVKRYTADPDDTRRASNNFDSTSGSCGISGSDFAYDKEISLVNDLPAGCAGTAGCVLMTRVRMLYNNSASHPLGFRVFGAGSTGLPAQGFRIDSLGAAGDSTRRVVVLRGYSLPPGIFDSAIFSYSDLTK